MKHLSILGSTGSIGRNTLAIVSMFPDRFSVKALTAKDNIEILSGQINQFQPDLAVVFDDKDADRLKQVLPTDTRTQIMHGEKGYKAAAALGKGNDRGL